MKKISFISCGVALMFLVVTVLAADKKQVVPSEADAKVEALEKKVDSLQSKIKELEQRMVKMEKTESERAPFVTPLTVVPGVVPQMDRIQNGFADPSHPPKIWGEGEFNGWKYYTIPLTATGQGTAEPIPLSGSVTVGR